MMRFISKDELPIGKFPMGHTDFDTTIVYGNACSVMMAERPAGYHSRPHVHDCEQINFVVEGELIIFIEGEGKLMKKGDYSRIPQNTRHWAWNQSDQPVVLLEVHSPGLQNDPKCSEYAYPLFDEGEEISLAGTPINIFLEDSEQLEALIRKAETPFSASGLGGQIYSNSKK